MSLTDTHTSELRTVTDDARQRLVGTWRLVAWEAWDARGRVSPAFEEPVGYLACTPDGYVFVQIMRPGARALSGDAFSGRADEIMREVGFGGYCGTYVIRDGVIAHNIEVRLFPDWPGSEKRRTFQWDGDRLILTTLPSIADGAPRVSRLAWERVAVRT